MEFSVFAADAAEEADDRPIIQTVQSGTYVREPKKDPPPRVLFLNPELNVSGTLSNYRSLGNFLRFSFGGGLGMTVFEDWHIRVAVRALSETHTLKERVSQTSTKHDIWFIQPTVTGFYRIVRYPEYHYYFPMDLFLGLKLGANRFQVDRPILDLNSKTDLLWGVAVMPRIYFWQGYGRFGLAPLLEVETIDYFKNFFFQFGASVFWDFETLGRRKAGESEPEPALEPDPLPEPAPEKEEPSDAEPADSAPVEEDALETGTPEGESSGEPGVSVPPETEPETQGEGKGEEPSKEEATGEGEQNPENESPPSSGESSASVGEADKATESAPSVPAESGNPAIDAYSP